MPCPNCGSDNGEYEVVHSVETHGLECGPYEHFDDEFIVCSDCHAHCDPEEWLEECAFSHEQSSVAAQMPATDSTELPPSTGVRQTATSGDSRGSLWHESHRA